MMCFSCWEKYMKKFVLRVVIFLFPIILLVIMLLPFYYIAFQTGELLPIDVLINKQRSNPSSLVGLAYNEQTAYYKLMNANYNEASVIALGTSRVMQFKEEFFKTSFYNCGGVITGTYGEYTNFLKNLDYKPEVVIIGVDTWHFNKQWNDLQRPVSSFEEITPIKRNNISIIQSIVNDYIDKKWTFSDITKYKENIGFNGRVKDAGFMSDGSYYYGNVYRDYEHSHDYQFVSTLERIKNGTAVFEWGDCVDEDTIKELNELLSYCYDNNIIVVGFLAPYAPTIYNTMMDSGNYSFFDIVIDECEKSFKKYDYEFYNYLTGDYVGLGDEFFIDGFHGGDIVYGKILLDMAQGDSKLRVFVDGDKIQSLIDNSYCTLTFYEP